MKTYYIILSTIGEFWTGSRWSREWPGAQIWTNRREAIAASNKLIGPTKVVKDYGLISEDVVYRS